MDTGRRRARPIWLAAAAALALAGCVNPAFRETVGEFGTQTQAAVAANDARLAALVAAEEERIRADLAERRADLRLHPECAVRLMQDVAAPGEPAPADAPDCRLVEQGGTPVEAPPRFDHILALSGALAGYGDSLTALVADASEDEAAFAESLSGLAGSLGGLDAAVRTLAGAPEGSTGQTLGAVAGIVAQAGNLYFAHARNRALKRIIIAGDPLVQEASRLLAATDERLRLYERADLAGRAVAAQRRVAELRAQGADPAAMRTAHDALFDAVAAYNRHGEDHRSFAAIGAAHARLREAAERGASPAELAAAVEAVIALAGAAHAEMSRLDEGSATDGR